MKQLNEVKKILLDELGGYEIKHKELSDQLFMLQCKLLKDLECPMVEVKYNLETTGKKFLNLYNELNSYETALTTIQDSLAVIERYEEE